MSGRREREGRPAAGAGRLLVVATPLGNLADLTLRAAEALKSATLVVCEDTRRTRALLTHLGANPRTLSSHKFNEASRIGKILAVIAEGGDVALVSDAGTPGLSDPGARVVAAAHEAGIRVEPVPGPAAPAAALSVSGFESGGFLFAGYLPARRAARGRFLGAILASEKARAAEDPSIAPWPLVFFETPHRIEASLADLAEVLGPRRVVIVREMTKIHEQILRTTLADAASLAAARGGRGEYTLVVEGASEPAAAGGRSGEEIVEAYRALVASGLDRREAMRRLARRTGMSRREIYDAVVEAGGGSDDGEGR